MLKIFYTYRILFVKVPIVKSKYAFNVVCKRVKLTNMTSMLHKLERKAPKILIEVKFIIINTCSIVKYDSIGINNINYYSLYTKVCVRKNTFEMHI
jgi:hypothetical protein